MIMEYNKILYLNEGKIPRQTFLSELSLRLNLFAELLVIFPISCSNQPVNCYCIRIGK
jgi:hypothetical protein